MLDLLKPNAGIPDTLTWLLLVLALLAFPLQLLPPKTVHVLLS